jgi:penicillin amidase
MVSSTCVKAGTSGDCAHLPEHVTCEGTGSAIRFCFKMLGPMSELTIPTPAKPERSGWQSFWRILLIVLLLLVIVAAVAFVQIHSAARAALPQLDGTIALAGLHARVEVLRDTHGVPSLRAQSAEDLFFAQGYVTAQDRLWQMDMMRRYGAGELSAALGAKTLKVDRRQRILGLRKMAQGAASQLSPRDRAWFEAYARGVNAYIQEHQHALPLEFRVLRYFPRAWTPEDSFLVSTVMVQMLNGEEYLSELSREKILQIAGPEKTSDLFPDHSYRDIPPGTDEKKFSTQSAKVRGTMGGSPRLTEENYPTLANSGLGWGTHERPHSSPTEGLEWATNVPEFEDPLLPTSAINGARIHEDAVPGSNNWVVSGARTASGRPLLSNDMHLGLAIPNIWYEARLSGGGFEVGGVTLPGMPGVIVGHNNRIAWGFTNLGPDVQDLYVETFNASGEYLTPQGWRKPEIRHEVIHVKGGNDVSIDVEETRHGPIITPLLKNDVRKLALRWTAYDPQVVNWVFFNVNLAQNWDEFQQAFSKFGAPGQNVVYADVDGNIGYHATGFVPVRTAGDGTLPQNGADDAHEWTGYIPFDQMAHVFNPPSGIIATANSRVTPDGYTGMITREWASPFRAERIYSVLHERQKLTAADMLNLQMDTFSVLDKEVAEHAVAAVDHTPNASKRAKEAATLLRSWDGRMDKDSAAAAIAFKTRKALRLILLESVLGEKNVDDYAWYAETVWLDNVLREQPARWLPSNYPSWDALMVASLEKGLKDAPKEVSSWHFGDFYKVEVAHQAFGSLPILNHWFSTGAQPLSGDTISVKQSARTFGPSERLTVDFSNFDKTTLNIVNGQSGHVMSPNFNDQWSAWYYGTTFSFPWTIAAVEKTTAHKLTLAPR